MSRTMFFSSLSQSHRFQIPTFCSIENFFLSITEKRATKKEYAISECKVNLRISVMQTRYK